MRRLLAATFLTSLCLLPATADDPQKAAALGWLGVMLQQSPPAEGALAGGVKIGAVIQDGPAERAGVRARDILLACNGAAVQSGPELIRRVSALPPGSWVDLALQRRGEPVELRVKLGSRPPDINRLKPRLGWIGLDAIDLPESLREHFGSPAEAGVMVAHVDPGSPAEAAGFELGDVLFEVDGEAIRSRDQLKARLMGAGVGNMIELSVMRSGTELQLEAMIVAAPEN